MPGVADIDLELKMGHGPVAELQRANAVIARMVPFLGRLGEIEPMPVRRLKMMGTKEHAFEPGDGQVIHEPLLR